MSEFDEALKRFDKMLVNCEPDANGKIFGSRAQAFMRDDEIVAIRAALTQAAEIERGDKVVVDRVIDPATDDQVKLVTAAEAVDEYASAHDSDGYEFNGDEYDLNLLTHFAEYIQWRGFLPQPPDSEGKQDD